MQLKRHMQGVNFKYPGLQGVLYEKKCLLFPRQKGRGFSKAAEMATQRHLLALTLVFSVGLCVAKPTSKVARGVYPTWCNYIVWNIVL